MKYDLNSARLRNEIEKLAFIFVTKGRGPKSNSSYLSMATS